MPQITTSTAILNAAKQAIEVLLRFKGIDVTLVPKNGTVLAKPGGGRDFIPAEPREPQKVSLGYVGAERIDNTNTDGGQYVTRIYALTGRHDMAIAVGDTWTNDEAEFTVESVDQTSGFKTSATVTAFMNVDDPLGNPVILAPLADLTEPTGWSCCGEGMMVDGVWQCCGGGVQ